jgi:hypothetical protein
MKFEIYLLVLCTLVFACRPASKMQKRVYSIPRTDTMPVVVAPDNKPIASDSSIKNIYGKLIENKLNFSTFNAKIKVEISSKEGKDEGTCYLRMRKDSAIWISMRGPLGIEGFRVLITRDSLVVINPINKNVQLRTIDYLQELSGIPINFQTLQDLVLGNPVFLDSNIISYKVNDNKELEVLARDSLFRNLLVFNNSNLKMLHSKLEGLNTIQGRNCDISCSDYDKAEGELFSKRRTISVSEKSKLDLDLDFKQYTFNQPLTFPFNIPKNYKRL